TAGVIQVGNGSAGTITLTAAINPVGTNILSLLTAASITEAAGTLTVPNLALRAGSAVTALNANNVQTVAGFVTSAGGPYACNATAPRRLGNVDGGDGVTTSNASIQAPAGSLTVLNSPAANDLGSGGGPISLTSNAFTNSAGAMVASGNNAIAVSADNMTL